MIEYIRGLVSQLSPTCAVLDVHGVGYKLHISLNTFSTMRKGEDTQLLVIEIIREDAHLLYGFAKEEERALFTMLTSVSGVGAATACTLLSAYSPADLSALIVNEDVKRIKQTKGIGQKTAERIIVELKDKCAASFVQSEGKLLGAIHSSGVADEAIQALTALGYPASASAKVITSAMKEQPEATVEQLIKWGLQHI